MSFGTSAHSFMDGKRWWNFSSLKRYINEIETNGVAVAGYENISREQQLNEYVMLALRSSGLNIGELKDKFNDSWLTGKHDYLLQLQNQNLLNMDNDVIRLTKKGYALCDEILRNLL